VVGENVVVVVDPWDVFVVAATTELAGGEGELTADPMAKPMPKEARTAARTSTRTTMPRRRVNTGDFCFTMKGNGTYGTCQDGGFGFRSGARSGGNAPCPAFRDLWNIGLSGLSGPTLTWVLRVLSRAVE
jgi:hypothetical protein